VTEPDALSEAIVAWTGYGEGAWPKRDEERVRERFGTAEADRLLPMVRDVERECWASRAHQTAPDLAEMATVAAGHLRERFPHLGHDAIEAVVWTYTFDNSRPLTGHAPLIRPRSPNLITCLLCVSRPGAVTH
jgi:hypothetical protein